MITLTSPTPNGFIGSVTAPAQSVNNGALELVDQLPLDRFQPASDGLDPDVLRLREFTRNGNAGGRLQARFQGTLANNETMKGTSGRIFDDRSGVSLRDQKEWAEAIYTLVATGRMAKGKKEQICLFYAQDIYNALMDQKESGKLPDLVPRIYGWAQEKKESVLGEAAQRQGQTEAEHFAHNLVVLEDKKGQTVMILDPWQTGSFWNDSPTVFHSVENYRAHRERGLGGLSGTLKRWPKEDEAWVRQHAPRTDYGL